MNRILPTAACALAIAGCTPAGPAPVTVETPPARTAAPVASAASPPCAATCLGEATPELIQALRDATQKAASCYKTHLRAGEAAGSATVSVQVDEQGAICHVEAKLDPTLAAMEPCVRARFEGLKLPPPRGGCLKANIPVHFAVRDEPGAELPAALVAEVVTQKREAVSRRCWKPALAANPSAGSGTVRVSAAIDIEPSGRVGKLAVVGAEKEYPGLAACVQEEIKTWTFPQAAGTTHVQIPFAFAAP